MIHRKEKSLWFTNLLLRQPMTFSEERYYLEFKRVRNRWRRYDPINLVLYAIQYANGGKDKLENIQRHPWLMMLLVKWILIDDCFVNPGRKIATEQEANQVFQAAYELSDFIRMPDEYQHFHLFMRAMAHQQFLYQKNFSLANFARQFVLFADLDDQHKLSRSFRASVGLEIGDFLSLTMGLAVKYNKGRFEPIRQHWFSTITLNNLSEKAEHYLAVLSSTPDDMRSFLSKVSGRQRLAHEFMEQTPLIAKPFLRLGDDYWPLHTAILSCGLEHFIYDHLRSLDPEKFMQSFGKIFEKYISELLVGVPSRVFVEDELKRLRSEDGKVVDFIVDEPNANIFIDAKGVSGTHEAMVTHVSQIVRDRTKPAALKALVQANELASDLFIGKLQDDAPVAKENNALIVVTYKELHLGNGLTFRDAVASDDVSRIYEGLPVCGTIPLEHVYFISIEAFEVLCGAVEAGSLTFFEAISHACKSDSEIPTKKFDFHQHLADMNVSRRIPNRVRNRLDVSINQLTQGLRENVS